MKKLLSILCFSIMCLSVSSAHATPPIVDDIEYTYDVLGRLIKVEYEDGTVVEYTYDKVGNRTQKIISNGVTIEYALTSTGAAVPPYFITTANYWGTIVYTLWEPTGSTSIYGWASTGSCSAGSPVTGWSHTGNGCEIRKD